MSIQPDWDGLSRDEQAERIQQEARAHGDNMSRHEAGLAAAHYAQQRLAERESRAVAAHAGFGGRGGNRMTGPHPWEEAERGPQVRPAVPQAETERALEPELEAG